MAWSRKPSRCSSGRRLPDSWLASVPGVREHEPLGPHSWYGIGGRARYFLELQDDGSLPELVARLNGEGDPYLVIGAATNTLFAGVELAGLTIKLTTQRSTASRENLVSAPAGMLMPRLAAEMAKAGRSGLEFGAGVPGAVGGSVFGNAGAFGREVKDCLVSAEIIDESGRRRTVTVAECRFGYRDSAFKRQHPKWVIVAATFKTQPEAPEAVRARLLEVQKHRRATQPIEQRSLGSTFKNPPGDTAGRLIDACSLKGLRRGGAQISAKHANFIVNLGGATAEDVLALMAEMRDRVRERFGIELEPEVRVVGQVPTR
jgi:UDP-N-acetylmuramate dehydrogenase